MIKISAVLAAVLMGAAAHCADAMVIVVTPDSALAANPAAVAAFNRAGQAWSSQFSNNITINISAGLSSVFVSPNIIGSTSSVKLQAPFDFFRNKIVASAASEPDDAIVAYLPTLVQFNTTLPSGFTFSNKFIATKANFKALGYMDLINLDQQYGATDSTITFNSNFAFDYDSSNGVDAGKIDFQSVATHEIGHALGFISSVDTVDAFKHNSTTTDLVITPLDLFRFQNDVAGRDPSTNAEFTSFPRYLDTGGSAIFDDLSAELALSTGVTTGDGLEASHWKDNAITGQYMGVMDPSMVGGITESITPNDLRGLDLIGYAYVPEPSGMAAILLVIPLFFRAIRRRY